MGKLANFANFWRARSRLYQNEILQENMRLTAFFNRYKMCILWHRCNLKILATNLFERSAIFVEIQQNVQNFANFQKIQLDSLVDFEKCCNSNKKKGPALFEKTDSLVLGARGST